MIDDNDIYGDVSVLLGKTLVSVEQDGRDEIRFVTDAGEKYVMRYYPDCCATCEIEDVVGDLSDLVGSPLTMAEKVTNSEDRRKGEDIDKSFTWTFYKFATVKGYVTIRWYGSSNGYYSESVTFEEDKRK